MTPTPETLEQVLTWLRGQQQKWRDEIGRGDAAWKDYARARLASFDESLEKVAALTPYLEAREQAHAEEVAKLKRRIELERNAYERLCICPDHRGKTNGRCIACQAEQNVKQSEQAIRADERRKVRLMIPQ